jgi:ATP/maltotriose-dependent transcriptional regulator MalT
MVDQFDGSIKITPGEGNPVLSPEEITNSFEKIQAAIAGVVNVLANNQRGEIQRNFHFMESPQMTRTIDQIKDRLIDEYQRRYGEFTERKGPIEIKDRHTAVLKLWEKGYSRRDMAVNLSVSEETIKKDLKVLGLKLR